MSRRVTILIALVLCYIVGGVFAVSWILQGKITATVTAEQWVLVDGKVMPDAGNIVETIDATLGFTSYSDPTHTLRLKNVATKVLTVVIESEQAPELQVFQEFKLTAPNDDVRFTNELTTWEGFKSISFQFLVESGSLFKPHVNIYLADVNCLMTTWTETGVKGGVIGEWVTVTYDREDFHSANPPASPAGGTFGPKYGFTIESYDSDYDDSTSAAGAQVGWFRNVVAYNTADEVIDITSIRLVPTTMLPTSGQVVDFRIGYYPTAGIGEVTIRTDIHLIGEAEAGFYPPSP